MSNFGKMKKDLIIKFSFDDWTSPKLLRTLNLKEVDTSDWKGTEAYKVKAEEDNDDRRKVRAFVLDLQEKQKEKREELKEARYNRGIHPFPGLIDMPETKRLHKYFLQTLEEDVNRDFYYTLLENNNMPVYQRLVWNLSDDYRSRKAVMISYDVAKGEDLFLDIFRSTLQLCSPCKVQSMFEYMTDQYAQLDEIDSKEETKKKKAEIRHDFHKALRQSDMLDNGHVENILHSLLNVSNIPHRAIEAIIEYVQEEFKVKSN